MNQVIKFRATLKGQVVCYIRIKPNADRILEQTWNTDNLGGWIFGEPPKHDNRDLFTNLLDESGKEIFEGDVVFGKSTFQTSSRGTVVKWEEELAGFAPFVHYDSDCNEYYLTAGCEVVGNVHENPELIPKAD